MSRSNEEGGAAKTGNRYCDRCGLSTVPRLEDVVGRAEVNLFHLTVVALLEHGGPMTVDQLAKRLSEAGAIAESGDMVLSLKRAWHGLEPVFKDPDGRLGLNVSSLEMGHVVWEVGLREPRFPTPVPPPAPDLPGAEVPLSPDELTAAFHDRGLYGFSVHRQAAAVLDVRGQPMPVEEVEEALAGLTQHRYEVSADRVRFWNSTLVSLDESGRLRLDRASPALAAMRQAVRKLARPVLVRRASSEQWTRAQAEREVELVEERRTQAQEAARLRRAVVRAVPDGEMPQAIAILDVANRSLRSFVGSEVSSVPDLLAGYDLLVGLHVREAVHRLGLDPDRWRLVDLKPPQRTRRLNRRGQTLKITPELLISSCTGISRPLGEAARVAQNLATGEVGKLTRRLESDVKALHAFYQYGVLHHCLRLRWGFLDEILSVDWALPGDPYLRDVLLDARKAGAAVEVVVGSAPGWAEPWSRARRCTVQEVEYWQVALKLKEEVWRLDIHEIQAVRVAGPPGAPSTCVGKVT